MTGFITICLIKECVRKSIGIGVNIWQCYKTESCGCCKITTDSQKKLKRFCVRSSRICKYFRNFEVRDKNGRIFTNIEYVNLFAILGLI